MPRRPDQTNILSTELENAEEQESSFSTYLWSQTSAFLWGLRGEWIAAYDHSYCLARKPVNAWQQIGCVLNVSHLQTVALGTYYCIVDHLHLVCKCGSCWHSMVPSKLNRRGASFGHLLLVGFYDSQKFLQSCFWWSWASSNWMATGKKFLSLLTYLRSRLLWEGTRPIYFSQVYLRFSKTFLNSMK